MRTHIAWRRANFLLAADCLTSRATVENLTKASRCFYAGLTCRLLTRVGRQMQRAAVFASSLHLLLHLAAEARALGWFAEIECDVAVVTTRALQAAIVFHIGAERIDSISVPA